MEKVAFDCDYSPYFFAKLQTECIYINANGWYTIYCKKITKTGSIVKGYAKTAKNKEYSPLGGGMWRTFGRRTFERGARWRICYGGQRVYGGDNR